MASATPPETLPSLFSRVFLAALRLLFLLLFLLPFLPDEEEEEEAVPAAAAAAARLAQATFGRMDLVFQERFFAACWGREQ